jgi:hypothetical protein
VAQKVLSLPRSAELKLQLKMLEQRVNCAFTD